MRRRDSRPSGLVLTLAALGAFLLGIGRVPDPNAPRSAGVAAVVSAPEASVPEAVAVVSAPGAVAGSAPGAVAGSVPGAVAASAPGAVVESAPGSISGVPVGSASGTRVESSVGAAVESASDAPAEPEPASVAAGGPEPESVPASASPRFLDIGNVRRPRVRAAAAILYNPRTDEVLWDRRGLDQRPIASITKVMTALVLLDQEPDLRRDVVVSRRDVRRASTTYLRRGERVTLEALLHLALIASDNVAARILARASGWGTRRFVEQMNRKAAALGLEGTRFVEPSGLDERNVSTPYDVARLIAAASEVPAVSRIMRKRTHRVRTDRRGVNIRNTNRLLRSRHVIQGGKTGYINEAGFCLTALFELPGADPIALVVLGAGSNAGRFTEARRLIDWVSTTGRSLIEPAPRAD